MYAANDIEKKFGVSPEMLRQLFELGVIESELECSKEEIFRILCARCLFESGADPAQVRLIISAIHPSRQLNVGVYTPDDGMLTVFFVPHTDRDRRRHALDEIWKIQSKSQVSVLVNFEKVLNDIEEALGAFEIKG
jgi:hypothetical protein